MAIYSGFTYILKIVIFHSYVNVYQRVHCRKVLSSPQIDETHWPLYICMNIDFHTCRQYGIIHIYNSIIYIYICVYNKELYVYTLSTEDTCLHIVAQGSSPYGNRSWTISLTVGFTDVFFGIFLTFHQVNRFTTWKCSSSFIRGPFSQIAGRLVSSC